MVERLEKQLDMLEGFAQAAFAEGKDEFLAGVATKLRLLLVRSHHNKPLLIEVADRFGVPLNVTVDGPPVEGSPRPGDVLSLDAFFDLPAVTVRTSAGLVLMTKRELIRAWSEQLGGAHEDWSVDESLVNAVRIELPVLGFRPSVMELRNCAGTALRYGCEVIRLARERSQGGQLT